ncbi:MAG: chemotaxis protein CheA, partial [Myxococcales bacterium]|nr:chemotaxis protein CheA [Myxococcales bacterium]
DEDDDELDANDPDTAPLFGPPPEATHALPDWVDPQMLGEFHDTQRHGLQEIEEHLLEATQGGAGDKEHLLRILHTLKGEAGTVGFRELDALYHALEDRIEHATTLSELVDDALAVKDWTLLAIGSVVDGEAIPSGVDELVRRLRTATTASAPLPTPTAPPSPLLPNDPEVLALFGEFHDEAMESLAQADDLLVGLEGGDLDPASVDALFRVFHTIKGLAGFLELQSIAALAHAAESLLDDARNDIGTLNEDRLDMLLRATSMVRSVLQATRRAVEQGSALVRVEGYDALLRRLHDAKRGIVTPTAGSAPRPAPAADQGGEGEAAPSGEKRSGGGLSVVRETIKVDLARVDSLVETIGELVIMDAMVSNGTQGGLITTRTRHQLAQLSKIVRDLQRQGLALRMVPLRGLFQKMSRLVRDLSRRSAKPIKLELSGQDAEMDRTLAERLGDPLVHMIRNGVDHGIEPPEQRRAAGKPEVATLRLHAYHEGGNIIVELSDDGRGLDRDAILAKAISRGLVMEGTQLPDREIFELIFHPGFSTAAKVTELSGRGVGMDVVKRTVEELRGRIQISSELGKGTTFRLVLPLTLAIIDGMLVVVGGRSYVLPTLSILESLQPLEDQLHRYAGAAQVLDLRGDQLPLVDLAGMLGLWSEVSEDPTRGFVIVVDGLHGRFGVLVDDLIGQQQVVIKQIDDAVNQLGLFSGAAILSDGHVGLILNPAALRSDERRGRRAGVMEAG